MSDIVLMVEAWGAGNFRVVVEASGAANFRVVVVPAPTGYNERELQNRFDRRMQVWLTRRGSSAPRG